MVVWHTTEPLSRAAAAAGAASPVLMELTALSDAEWLTAVALQLADGSSVEAGAGLTGLGVDLRGLAAATGDELSVALDADFDDLQQSHNHDLTAAL